eukprot:gene12497-14764_t
MSCHKFEVGKFKKQEDFTLESELQTKDPDHYVPPLGEGLTSADNGNVPLIHDAELNENLANLLPPRPTKWNSLLPGVWCEPDGFKSAEASSMDAFLWAFWWLARAKPRRFFNCMVIIGAQGVVSFYIPDFIQRVMVSECGEEDEEDCGLIPSTESIVNVSILAVLFLLKTFLKNELSQQTPAGGSFVPATRTHLVEQILGLSFTTVENLDSARMHAILQEDIDILDNCILASILTSSAITQLAFTIGQLFTFNSFELLLVMFLAILTLLVYLSRSSKLILKMSEQKIETTRAFMSVVQEILEKGTTILVMGIEQMTQRTLVENGDGLQKSFSDLKKALLQTSMKIDMIRDVAVLCVLGGGMMLVNSSRIDSVSVVVAFYGVIQGLFEILAELAMQLRSFQIAAPSLRTITKLLLSQRLTYRGKDVLPKADIDVDDVWFSYEGQEDGVDKQHAILKGCSLTIPSGHKVALVGASGMGKSTLMKVLARQYLPESGVVRVGGAKLEQLDIHAMVGCMEQSSTLYNNTVAYNIDLEAGFTRAQIEEAATVACVIGQKDTAWILPDGVDTQCGHRGGRFSVGMQQRIVLARILIRKTPVLLLDEATAGLDVQAISEVEAAILNSTSHVSTSDGKV